MKVGHFVDFQHQSMKFKEKEKVTPEAQVQATARLLEEMRPGDLLVCFDQRGKALTSEDFAQQVQRVLESGKQTCWWVFGGSYGIAPDLLKRADLRLALAPFVMSHQVAELVALEQVYRSFTILNRIPYHNP